MQPLSEANITSHDDNDSFAEDDSSVARPAASYSRVRVRRVVKRRASNKLTSPTVARKLKALEEDAEFHYSILKDARHMLNAELANITQQRKPESKCTASARNEVLENLAGHIYI